MIEISLSNNINDIPVDKELWNSLIKDNETNTIFQTYEWFHAWWNSYGNKHQLVFLTAYYKSKIIGFAPLMVCKEAFSQRVVRFVGDSNTDYCDFVTSKNRLKTIDEFIRYLYSGKVKWTSIVLLNIPDYSTSISCLRTISHKKSYNIQIKSPVPAPVLLIKENKNNAGKLSNKYSVKRHIKKISSHGKLNFNNYYTKNEILNHINNFFVQHIDRYKLKGKNSQFTHEINKEYFIDIVNALSPNKWLIFSILSLDNNPIAYHFGFEYNNKLIWYKPSFNIKYKDFSPGSIMLKHLIDHSVLNDLDELDFTIGDEAFKDRFSNHIRYNYNVIINRSRIRHITCLIRKLFSRLIQCVLRK